MCTQWQWALQREYGGHAHGTYNMKWAAERRAAERIRTHNMANRQPHKARGISWRKGDEMLE